MNGAINPKQSTRVLRRQLAHCRANLARKEAVMNRHAPGTSPHTIAKQAAESYRSCITRIEYELRARGVSFF